MNTRVKILLLILLTLFCSCKNTNQHLDKKISIIQNSNFELFEGVRIESRYIKDGIHQAPFFTKQLNNRNYFLPNASYYGCDFGDFKCLEKATEVGSDPIDFAYENNVSKEKANIFIGDYTKKIIREFEKLRLSQVLSDSKIGDCLIFFLKDNYRLIHVNIPSEIYNSYWKTEILKAEKINQRWYLIKK